jgi:riboflavin kinase, archaea type
MHLILRGEIRTGVGNFAYWLHKLEPYYTRKTGMRLFPGTLNVHLTCGSYRTPTNPLRLEKEEYDGRVSVSIVPCKIFGRNAFILRPDTDTGKHGDPPERILEIATDVNLRDTYNLKDGDVVDVEVSENSV